MSAYRYEDSENCTLVFLSEPEHGEVQIRTTGRGGCVVPFEDVPTVVLELLKQAGYADEALRNQLKGIQ